MAESFSTPEKVFTCIDYTPPTKQLGCVLCTLFDSKQVWIEKCCISLIIAGLKIKNYIGT